MNNYFPTSVFCIIATEFCERFSFCGLRTILSLYLRNELLVQENMATITYHIFIMFCYLIPIVGAICADGILGRYRTILYFSIIYLVGNTFLCFAATPVDVSPYIATAVGLLLIAIGTGGIKPCVAAFGGDQFVLPQQQDRLQGFFSVFYFAINTGGLVGMLVTPVLRKATSCFGQDTCYALGFGFPAALMLLALALLVLGKRWYRMKKPKNNLILQFFHCTTQAIIEKLKAKRDESKKQHWLDYAEATCEKKLIDDMKLVYSIMFLYIPLPIFWSLFDQQGSRWTFQASRTNGTVSFCGLNMQILPDQMQVVNPAIVLILIPLFEKSIYPCCTPLQSALRRMVAGGVAAGFAFLASGLLELKLQETYPILPNTGTAAVNVINTLECSVEVFGFNSSNSITLAPRELHTFRNITSEFRTVHNLEVSTNRICSDVQIRKHLHNLNITLQEYKVHTLLIGLKDEGDIFVYLTEPVDFSKSLNGKPRIRIAYMHGANDIRNVSVALKSADTDSSLQDIYFVADAPEDFFSLSDYMELPPGRYTYEVLSTSDFINSNGTISLELGGVYTLVIREFRGAIHFTGLYTMAPPNEIHMLWLLPQYFLLSVGEIMFAISGLEFSFTQAPKSMKTIIIAFWYLTVALGNLLVILIAQASFFRKQSEEFFMFAVLIFVDMAVFSAMCIHFKPIQIEGDGSSCSEMQPLLGDSVTALTLSRAQSSFLTSNTGIAAVK